MLDARIGLTGVAAVTLVSLCVGTLQVSPATAGGGRDGQAPTLGSCVSKWNHASLGDRDLAAIASASAGSAALVAALADGSCTLVFPPVGGHDRVFVTGLDGDYALDANPLGEDGPHPAVEEQLAALVERETDVHVIPRSRGMIAADRHARMPTLRLHLLDTGADCHQIWTPTGLGYALVRTTVLCPWVRSIIWSWSAHEHPRAVTASPHAEVHILGWRCGGTDYGDGEFTQVICRTATNLIEVAAVKAHVFS